MIPTTPSPPSLTVTCPHCGMSQLVRVVSGKAICRAAGCGGVIRVETERVGVKRA